MNKTEQEAFGLLSWEHVVDYLGKLRSVMRAVKKEGQVQIHKHLQHERAIGCFAGQFPWEKARWHFSSWNQDHQDHPLVTNTCTVRRESI